MTTWDDFIVRLTNLDNLYFAWKKVKKLYWLGDALQDFVQLSNFEDNIQNELKTLAEEFLTGEFKPQEVYLLTHPKKGDEVRQYYRIHIRDQVAWMAIINIIAPYCDNRMPKWSFGHRIHRPEWKESGKSIIGWHINSSPKLYKSFEKSWPLFKRSISLTLSKMAKNKPFTKHEEELDEIINGESSIADSLKLSYLKDEFWLPGNFKDLHWCSFDLEKFYPNINQEAIIESLGFLDFDEKIQELIKNMLIIEINHESFNKAPSEIKKLGISSTRIVTGIPTGLFVAGFLANLAMFQVDHKVDKIIHERNPHDIAHFRYVDDHIVITNDIQKLKEWIHQYEELLNKYNLGVFIKDSKTEPEGFEENLRNDSFNKEKLTKFQNSTRLDPKFPEPLMTQTMALFSTSVRTPFEILDDDGIEDVLTNLKHLMLSNISEIEIRKDTRVTFGASKIAKLAQFISTKDCHKELMMKIQNCENYLNLNKGETKSTKSFYITKKHKKDPNYVQALEDLNYHWSKANDHRRNKQKELFYLMKKALHDNQHKNRMWSNMILFCYKTGVNGVNSIIDELRQIKKNKALSYPYSYSILLQTLTYYVAYSLVKLLKQTDSKCQIENSILFIHDVCKNLAELLSLEPSSKYKYIYFEHLNVFSCIVSLIKATEFKKYKFNISSFTRRNLYWKKNRFVDDQRIITWIQYNFPHILDTIDLTKLVNRKIKYNSLNKSVSKLILKDRSELEGFLSLPEWTNKYFKSSFYVTESVKLMLAAKIITYYIKDISKHELDNDGYELDVPDFDNLYIKEIDSTVLNNWNDIRSSVEELEIKIEYKKTNKYEGYTYIDNRIIWDRVLWAGKLLLNLFRNNSQLYYNSIITDIDYIKEEVYRNEILKMNLSNMTTQLIFSCFNSRNRERIKVLNFLSEMDMLEFNVNLQSLFPVQNIEEVKIYILKVLDEFKTFQVVQSENKIKEIKFVQIPILKEYSSDTV